jgi:hypothetical protein
LASNQVENPTKTLNSREYTNRKDHKSKAKDPTCKAANIIHGELERARYSEIIAPFSISCNYNLHAFFSVSSFDITLFFFFFLNILKSSYELFDQVSNYNFPLLEKE